MIQMRTMTVAQMNWNLNRGFAWLEHEDAEWTLPIWTKDGGWVWNNGPEQRYELVIV